MLIVVFSLKFDWLPATGMESVAMFYEGWDRVVDIARHLVLPAITLSLFYLALYTRLMRAAMLEQYGMDYVVMRLGQSSSTVRPRSCSRILNTPTHVSSSMRCRGKSGTSRISGTRLAPPTTEGSTITSSPVAAGDNFNSVWCRRARVVVSVPLG